MNKHHSGSEWELKWWFVDRRNGVVGQKWKNSGPEKWEWIGEKWDRSEKRKKKTHHERRLNRSLDRERIGVDRSDFRRVLGVDRSLDREWIGVDRSDFRRVRRAWIVSGSEWIGVIFVECVELGSWADRSLAASSRERIGVDRSLAASSLDRGASVWIVSFGLVCGSEQSSSERGSACEREMENVWSENLGWNWFPLVFAYFTVKLKIFLVWPNLPCQPNMLFSGKWFPNFAFSQNKRKCKLHPLSFRSFLFWPLSF